MEENLITKKELLEIAGISYGALYRWKRMKLLPDDWFIHRSTVTGHETFFPRDKVLERVAQIQQMKGRMSLEEIARQFMPGTPREISLTPGEAATMGVAPTAIVNQYLALVPAERLDYQGLLSLYVFSQLLQEGRLSRDEALEAAQAAGDTGDVSEPVVYLLRKYGVAFCVTAGEMQHIQWDKQGALAATVVVSTKKAALSALLKEKGAFR